MIKVSVIIPHYNRSALLRETIASVKEQSFKDWEIIIVDDGSDDSEFDAIQIFQSEQVKVIKRTQGIKGPSYCRNLGANVAMGEYLLFLDSDDLLAAFCLEQRVNVMDYSGTVDMAVFLMENFSGVPGDTKTYFNIDAPFESLTGLFLQNQNPWQTMAPIWRREFFERLGGFDEELLFMEDPELHLRVLGDGTNFKICYEYPADCFYRINNVDETKQAFWYNSIYYRILFFKKLTEKKELQNFVISNPADIRVGVFNMVKTFLYARKNKFPELYTSLEEWMKESRLFSNMEIAWLRTLLNVGNSNSGLLKRLSIKGICFRLLPTS